MTSPSGETDDREVGLPRTETHAVPEDLRPPVPRWIGHVFFGLGVLTVPWVLYLAMTLPERSGTGHYRLAWVGFDLALVACLIRTGVSAWRGHDSVAVPATATATLLMVDVWFDVLTSQGRAEVAEAMLLAAVVELPLAAACIWLAAHAEAVRADRLRFWQRRTALAVARADAVAPSNGPRRR